MTEWHGAQAKECVNELVGGRSQRGDWPTRSRGLYARVLTISK
jgi:hypothetical protein